MTDDMTNDAAEPERDPEAVGNAAATGESASGAGEMDGASAGAAPEAPGTDTDAEASGTDGEAEAGAPGAPDTPAAEGAAEEGAVAKPARRKPKDAAVARAHRTRLPIEGTVVAVIKGGYEIRLGKSRAFCPHSQIDVVRVDEPESVVGRTMPFLVTQYRRGGDDVVVSRRALLEEERTEEAKAVRATLIEGGFTQGHIVGVAPFGAFVDLGAGVQGLVHISELSHRRVQKVEDAVQVGDTVQVKILRIEHDGQRISLSVRRAQKDPWSGIAERFAVGSVHPGTVVRLADFGAFVEVEPGIEALAPAREFPPLGADWKDGLEPGASRSWRVLSVDRKRRRMSVVPDVEGIPHAPIDLEPGATVDGRVQKIERFGVFVWIAPGQVGLMPAPLSGVPQGTRLDARYRPGEAVRVQVVAIEEEGRRIRLAAEGVDAETVAADRDRGAPRSPRPGRRDGGERSEGVATQEPSGPFGSSLGDALRAALGGGRRDDD